MSTTLIMTEGFFNTPISQTALDGDLKSSFDNFLGEIELRVPCDEIRRNFRTAVRIAARNPKSLYQFFHKYNFFNTKISSTIGHLIANITSSENVFIDHGSNVYASQIASFLSDAYFHELGDPDHRDARTHVAIPHRILSTGVRDAVGNYAGLSTDERVQFQTSLWQKQKMEEITQAYNGVEDDAEKIAFGLGVHNMSEFLASMVEFPTVCDELFCQRKGQGFHAYLEEHPLITVQGFTFPAMSWLLTHGGYDPESGEIVPGVEYEHLKGGFLAAAMMISKTLPENRAAVLNAFYEGTKFCANRFNEYFVYMGQECDKRFFRPSFGVVDPAFENRCEAT